MTSLAVCFFFQLHPNPTELLGLTNATQMYIEWHWYNPREVLLFAHEGGSDVFGIWMPKTNSKIFRQPIIEVGAIHEEGCMGVVGTNLESFLLGTSAYSLIWSEIAAINAVDEGEDPNAPKKLNQIQTALEMLQVPRHLRTPSCLGVDPFYVVYDEQLADEHLAEIRKWADPLLPDSLLASYGSYKQEYTVTDLKKLFGEP